MNDLWFACRQWGKHPGLTAVSVLTLALGIGANSALFSVINQVLLTPLPFAEPDRLMMIRSTDVQNQISGGSVAGPDFVDWRRQSQSFSALAAAQLFTKFNLSGRGEPRVVQGAWVTPGFFELFRLGLAAGRTFREDEAEPGRDAVVLLGHGLWQREFGADPNVVGQTLVFEGHPCTVVGVLSPTMAFIDDSMEAYRPLSTARLGEGRGNYYLAAFGRLKPGVTCEQAQTELASLCAAIAREFPWKGGRSARVLPLHDELVKVARPALLVLYGAVAVVLLIACVNVGNLLLARAEGRRREMAVRASLGASRGRIIRQLLTESVVLSLAGGALGLAFAQAGIQVLLALSPQIGGRSIPFFEDIALDGRLLIFTTVVAVGSGVLFGLAPAWQATRFALVEALKESARSTPGARRHRLLEGFVVAQVALSVLLLCGAGLMVRSFARLAQVDPGFDPHRILTAQLDLPQAKYHEESLRLRFYSEVLERIRALPGVESAGAINLLPMGNNDSSWDFRIQGEPELPAGRYNLAEYRVVSVDYRDTLRLPLKQGRWFTDQDQGEPPVLVINQTLASRFFGKTDPLGRRIVVGSFTNGCEIVGVVGDDRAFGLGEAPPAVLYLPITQNCWHLMALVVRTRVEPMSLARALREQIWAVDPDQPVTRLRTMEDTVRDSISVQRFAALLLGVFAGVALALAALGVYGVLAYWVSQRRQELGVRMALGAKAGDLLTLVLQRGGRLLGLGLATGLAGALAVSGLIQRVLYESNARDPWVFACVTVVLGLVGLGACYLPAARASRVSPSVALRCE